MKNVFIYIFIVLLCLMGVLRLSAEHSVDNLITSIAPSVFELSVDIEDDNYYMAASWFDGEDNVSVEDYQAVVNKALS